MNCRLRKILRLANGKRMQCSGKRKKAGAKCASAASVLGGGRPKSRYLLFHIPIRLEKKMHFVDNGRFRKGYEKVVVRERYMSSTERQKFDEEVLAR